MQRLRRASRRRRRRRSRAPAARSTSTSGVVPAGRLSHAARCAARPRACAADSGYSKPPCAGAVGAHHDREQRLVGILGVAREQLFDGLRVLDDRRHEQSDHRVDVRVGEDRADRALVGGCIGRSEQVDRVRDARLLRNALDQHGPRLRRQLRQDEAVRLARVGAEDAQAAGVREDGDAVSRGRGQRREQHCGVEQLLQGRRAQHAGFAEERVDDGVGAGQGGGVRGRGARTGAARAAAHREDRLRARHPARNPCELARVAERLEVEQDDVRLGIVLPVLEQVVRRDVRLVADRHERRQAEPPRVGLLEQRQAERAALRRERGAAGREGAPCERRVQTGRPPMRRRGSSARSGGRRSGGRGRAAAPGARVPRSRSRQSPPR